MGKDTFVNSGGPDPFEARVGSVLAEKWTLVRLIGVGGMASVYEARHQIGRREAIKILHPEVARQEELRKRFEQEAYAVNELEHPGVVAIRDVGTSPDGCPFLVMELLEGATLAERVLEQSLASDDALRYIDELLAVLSVAHEAGIIHRDLKPDNLFITNDGTLKVLDFGIARVRASGAMKVVTQTGTALGTPSYMPPEQVKGVDVDHRADLFAVGAILWELLTGRDVHPASSHQELLVKMLTTPAPPISSVAKHVPEPIAQVVDRALAFEPQDRYPDARTMRRDLEEARAGRPPPFAIAAPASIHDRSTVARTPKAIQGTQIETPSPHSAALTGNALAAGIAAPAGAAQHTGVAAHTGVTTLESAAPSENEEDRKKLIAAIIVVGTLVGMLATVLILRGFTGETTDDVETIDVDDDGESRRRRRSDKNLVEPGADASADAPGSSVSPDPDPVPDPAGPDPTAPNVDPEPTAPPPNVDPAPIDPKPAPGPQPNPKTQPPAPKPPPPKPPKPPPHPSEKKKNKKNKKKNKKKKNKGRGHDDDD